MAGLPLTRFDEIGRVLIGVTSDPPLQGSLDRVASQPGPDWWQDLVEEALRHRVGFHLLQSQSGAGSGRFPQVPRLRLELQVSEVNRWLDLRLIETRRVLGHLEKVGLRDCVVLKGPPLCALYPSPYFHPLADLDLFAPTDGVDLLLKGLDDLGYRARMWSYAQGKWHDATPSELRRRRSETRDLPAFARSQQGITYAIDVKTPRHHTEFRPLVLEDMFERAESDEACGITLRRLSWPDTLLWLAAHTWGHTVRRRLWLEQLTTLDRLIRARITSEGWEQVVSTTERYAKEQERLWPQIDRAAREYAMQQGMSASWPDVIWEDVRAQVHLPLSLAKQVYGSPVPQSVLEATKPADVRLLDLVGDGSGFPLYRFYLWQVDPVRRIFGVQWLPLEELIKQGALEGWFGVSHTFATRLGPERPIEDFA